MTIEHKLILPSDTHSPYTWIVPNEATRLALVIDDLNDLDLGKYCWQQDDNSTWSLIQSVPPVWKEIGGIPPNTIGISGWGYRLVFNDTRYLAGFPVEPPFGEFVIEYDNHVTGRNVDYITGICIHANDANGLATEVLTTLLDGGQIFLSENDDQTNGLVMNVRLISVGTSSYFLQVNGVTAIAGSIVLDPTKAYSMWATAVGQSVLSTTLGPLNGSTSGSLAEGDSIQTAFEKLQSTITLLESSVGNSIVGTGFAFQYDSASLSMSDPGWGRFRLNAASLGAVTQITFSRYSESAKDLAEVFELNTNAILQIFQEGSRLQYASYPVVSVVPDVALPGASCFIVTVGSPIAVGDMLTADSYSRLLIAPSLFLRTPQCAAIACTDELTAVNTLGDLTTFHIPFNFHMTGVLLGLTTAQASGTRITVNCTVNGVSNMFTTPPSLDNTETNSSTSSVPAVLMPSALSLTRDLVLGDRVTVILTAVGDGTARGLKIYLIGYTVP